MVSDYCEGQIKEYSIQLEYYEMFDKILEGKTGFDSWQVIQMHRLDCEDNYIKLGIIMRAEYNLGATNVKHLEYARKALLNIGTMLKVKLKTVEE